MRATRDPITGTLLLILRRCLYGVTPLRSEVCSNEPPLQLKAHSCLHPMATSTQWQLVRDAATRYQQVLVPTILGPAARALVKHAAPTPGNCVLDVGCGTGAAARSAAELVGADGRVIGIDLNGSMIDVARSCPPVPGSPVAWHEASAYALPVADETMDVVLCAQVLQFLDDPQQALHEMRRVVKPEGLVALSIWCDLDESPYFHALVEAVAKHITPEAAAGLRAAFTLSQPHAIRALLEESAFSRIEVTACQLDLSLPKLTDFVPRHIRATPMAAGYNASSRPAQERVVNEVETQLAVYRTLSGARVLFRMRLATARM